MQRTILLVLIASMSGAAALVGGCARNYARRSPLGERFPAVEGQSLNGRTVRLPRDVAGKPALLLVGYEQKSQFDIDRWLIGARQVNLAVKVYELPTIAGIMPRLFARRIDAGMRRGIPAEDWSAVVTIYADAARLQRFTGTENRLPGRVLLLDGSGRVVFFHDRGFSVGALYELRAALARLQPSTASEGRAGEARGRSPGGV